MDQCKQCFAIWLARPGYHCYLGALIQEMEREQNLSKRFKLRREMDWALGRLREIDAFEQSRRLEGAKAKAKSAIRYRRLKRRQEQP